MQVFSKAVDNISMKTNYRKFGRDCYQKEWSNKSDKSKSRNTLKHEIAFIMAHGEFSKNDLIGIRNLTKLLGIE